MTRLTAERARQLVSYDEETGAITWLVSRPGRCRIGGLAGSVNAQGYVMLSLDGQRYCGHRVAWLHVHGCWPSGQIDHIDGDRSNNALRNLRDVPSGINSQNQRRARVTNRQGALGVGTVAKTGKYHARITVRGVTHGLGYAFNTIEEAHAAYVEAKRRLHEGGTL